MKGDNLLQDLNKYMIVIYLYSFIEDEIQKLISGKKPKKNLFFYAFVRSIQIWWFEVYARVIWARDKLL